jgi:hypothetical protein
VLWLSRVVGARTWIDADQPIDGPIAPIYTTRRRLPGHPSVLPSAAAQLDDRQDCAAERRHPSRRL